jgi:hypothetical protein
MASSWRSSCDLGPRLLCCPVLLMPGIASMENAEDLCFASVGTSVEGIAEASRS